MGGKEGAWVRVLEGGGGKEGEREGGREEGARGRDKEMGVRKCGRKECVHDKWRGERIRTGRQCPSSGNLQIHSRQLLHHFSAWLLHTCKSRK